MDTYVVTGEPGNYVVTHNGEQIITGGNFAEIMERLESYYAANNRQGQLTMNVLLP